MSGIFIDGKWHETTGRVCKRCRSPVWSSSTPEYSFQCLNCGEDLYSIMTEEQDPHDQPRIIVARRVDGITLNTALEVLLGDDGKQMVFDGQPEAEKFLLDAGFAPEDLEHIYFIEVDNEQGDVMKHEHADSNSSRAGQ